MKSTLPKRPRAETPVASAPAVAPAPAPKFTPRGSAKSRILVAVTDEKIDFQAMSPEAAKALNELMHKPDVQQQFGIGPLTDHFDLRHCARIYQAIGLVIQGIAHTVLKMPDQAVAVLAYTDKEKDELAEPTAKALDELAPTWLRQNQAVAALVLVFAAITQNKIQEAMMITRRLAQEKTADGEKRIEPAARRIVVPAVPAA